jgi:hypothetical protein
MRTIAYGVALAGALSVVGCSKTNGTIARLIGDVGREDYSAATERCEWLSRHDDQVTDKGAVRYRVYCGLAYVHSGQKDKGIAMLAEGRELYNKGNEMWLDHKIVEEMESTLEQAGKGRTGAK